MNKFKFLPVALLASITMSACGGGGAESVALPPAPVSVQWVQTANSVKVDQEAIGIWRSRAGYGAADLYGNLIKSFMFPSGAEFNNTARSPNDKDFTTFSFDSNNQIFLDVNPVNPKYVAGFVTDQLHGNFGHGNNSIVMIDQGRESTTLDPRQWENSYLWRMDKVNGTWQVNEFGKDIGKQFWHSSSNPLDVNGDGILDFSVTNLTAKQQNNLLVLFTPTATSEPHVDLTNYICQSYGQIKGSGSTALIKLANGTNAVISMPYVVNAPWDPADQASIIHLDSAGRPTGKDCITVRGTAETSGLNNSQGFNTVKVMDINNDGRLDFIATAEYNTGSVDNKYKFILYFLQQANSTFKIANNELGLSTTITLPNADTDQWSDWISNNFIPVVVDSQGTVGIFYHTRLIKHSQIESYGIRGGVKFTGNVGSVLSIRPSDIKWNSESKPFNYHYVIPTELNNDGIVDFLLVADCAGAPCYRVSAIMSKVN